MSTIENSNTKSNTNETVVKEEVEVEIVSESSQSKSDNPLVDELVESVSSIVVEWSHDKPGDIGTWFQLLQSVMSNLQGKQQGKSDDEKMTGIEKMEVATNVVVKIGKGIWDKHMEGLPEEERERLRNGELKVLAAIIENPFILQGATSFLKKILKVFDYNQDGKITKDECSRFWCCGDPTKCGPPRNAPPAPPKN